MSKTSYLDRFEKPVLLTCPHRDFAWASATHAGKTCIPDGKLHGPAGKRVWRLATEAEAARAGLTLDFDNPRPAA